MKAGEIIKEEKIKLDPKWGKEDFSRMKDTCVSCGGFLPMNKKRFIVQGNYCNDCSFNCGHNVNRRKITIKPNE